MSQVTVTVDNETTNVFVNLSPEEAAREYALRAEAAEAATELSEDNAAASAATATTQAGIATTQAGIAATQANTATTQAGISTTQAGIATTQAGVATTQAGNALGSANSAAASASTANTQANNALGSANSAAANAATATTQAGIATTQAGTATAQAGIATTQAGIATTKAAEALTSANNALAAENAAEAARDQILAKAEINLTTNGHILRADGSLFKSVDQREFLRTTTPFQQSPVNAMLAMHRLVFYDSFIRVNQTGLGVADSGQTWLTFRDWASFNIVSNEAQSFFSAINTPVGNVLDRGNLAAVDNGGRASCEMGAMFATRISNFGFIVAVNNDRYIFTQFTGTNLEVYTVIDGVTTLILNVSLNAANINFTNNEERYFFKMYFRSTISEVRLTFEMQNTLAATVGLNATDRAFFNQGKARFFGIRGLRTGGSSFPAANSFYLKNTSLFGG